MCLRHTFFLWPNQLYFKTAPVVDNVSKTFPQTICRPTQLVSSPQRMLKIARNHDTKAPNWAGKAQRGIPVSELDVK